VQEIPGAVEGRIIAFPDSTANVFFRRTGAIQGATQNVHYFEYVYILSRNVAVPDGKHGGCKAGDSSANDIDFRLIREALLSIADIFLTPFLLPEIVTSLNQIASAWLVRMNLSFLAVSGPTLFPQ
jgi:hypothetical protein